MHPSKTKSNETKGQVRKSFGPILQLQRPAWDVNIINHTMITIMACTLVQAMVKANNQSNGNRKISTQSYNYVAGSALHGPKMPSLARSGPSKLRSSLARPIDMNTNTCPARPGPVKKKPFVDVPTEIIYYFKIMSEAYCSS